MLKLTCLFSSYFVVSALAKENGNDEDMVEMIAFEVESLSSEIKELEEKLKVLFT